MGYALLLALLALLCKYPLLLSPGILPELNYEISVTSTSPCNTTTKLLNAGARPKQRIIAALTPQQQPNEEIATKWHPYHMPLGTHITNELLPK